MELWLDFHSDYRFWGCVIPPSVALQQLTQRSLTRFGAREAPSTRRLRNGSSWPIYLFSSSFLYSLKLSVYMVDTKGVMSLLPLRRSKATWPTGMYLLPWRSTVIKVSYWRYSWMAARNSGQGVLEVCLLYPLSLRCFSSLQFCLNRGLLCYSAGELGGESKMPIKKNAKCQHR